MNGKMKTAAVIAIVCVGTCVFAGPRHHHNDGLALANGIVDLVCRVIQPAPVVVAPAPVVVQPAPAVVQPAPVVVQPAPVVVTQPQPVIVAPAPVYYTRPVPPPPRRPRHRGGRHRR